MFLFSIGILEKKEDVPFLNRVPPALQY